MITNQVERCIHCVVLFLVSAALAWTSLPFTASFFAWHREGMISFACIATLCVLLFFAGRVIIELPRFGSVIAMVPLLVMAIFFLKRQQWSFASASLLETILLLRLLLTSKTAMTQQDGRPTITTQRQPGSEGGSDE